VSMFIFLLSVWCRKALLPSKPFYSIKRWNFFAAISSFQVGLIWGMVPVLFFAQDNIIYLAFIIALYTGYVSGGLAVSFTYHRNFIIFSAGLTIPFAARMLYQGGSPYTAIGGLAIFYCLSLIYVSKNSSDLFLASTKIQYENTEVLAELAREKEAVEQAVAAKDRFLASASHDLRQPLNAISLFAVALQPLQTEKLGNEIVDKILLSLKGLNGMLHSLLDISRLDADVVENQPKHMSLQTLVNQLCDEYQEKAPHLIISSHIEQQITIFVDPTILYRVVRNLIDNAVKYTTQGEIKIIAKVIDDDIVELSISDTGIGIPEDKIATVFNEFEQLNNPERNREKGLGLGLAIVRRLCAIAAIKIELNSTLGQGTVVTIQLATAQHEETVKSASPVSVELSGKLALVIDDEHDILFGMQKLLSGWGCQVIVSDSLQQAIDKLGQYGSAPDFIVSDLRLRAGEQGDDAIEAIREEFNLDIPAIVVTGDTAPQRVAALKESGLAVLYKPIDPSDLKEQLDLLLS
ncbi:MAG: hybrid sensor histidine kinase/response regulator, partial [Arenicella sp.]|nr:hybrid sensor histidine kinase/response regulator [Arenicella sp.]